MVRTSGQCIGGPVKAALFRDAVVAIGGVQRGFAVLRFLYFDDIGHIEQLVVPSVERNDLAWVVGEQVGDDAGLDRRDDLLALRGIGRDRIVDRVAARFFVIGNDLLEVC